MDTDALARASARAGQQHSFITYRQALDAGLSPDMVRHLVVTGVWTRAARGLYRISGVKVTWRGRMMAAYLQAGDHAMISHRSAAALWTLEGFEPPTTIDLTVPPERRPRIARTRVHRRPMFHRAVRDAIPLTPIPETLLDLCAVSRNPGIPLRALDDVRRRKLVSGSDLQRCLAENAPRRLPGVPLTGPCSSGGSERRRREPCSPPTCSICWWQRDCRSRRRRCG